MTTLSPCPLPAELEQFLLGCAAEDRWPEMEEHVQGCRACQQRMQSLSADDELVQALRSPHPASLEGAPEGLLGEARPELVNILVPHFKRIANVLDETILVGSGSTHSSAGVGAPSLSLVAAVPAAGSSGQLGRYEIRGVLGRGGMGTVLHAFDPLLNRSIAVKVLQAEWLAEPGMAERMVGEAQAAAAVEHDNIVSIYAVELWNGNPCIVMPLLPGVSLQQRLQDAAGPLPLAEILRIAREASLGLAAAHAAGLIHCDIKPANLWLEAPQDRVKILDFGLAVTHGEGHGNGNGGVEKNAGGGISGTPGYLAPEQARGLPLDQRTDLFSLGCVLYRMATGQAPFTGESRLKVLWTVLSPAPVAASELNPELPVELSELIGCLMARDAADRPTSATRVLEALDAIERRLTEQRGAIIRRRRLMTLLGAAVLGGSAVGTWALFAGPREAQPVPVTFAGDHPVTDVLLRRDEREWPLTLGPEITLSLPPGDYTVRPVSAWGQRRLVPEQFTVAGAKSQVVRIAFVGEIDRHAQHTRMVTGLAVLPGAIPPVIFSVGQDRALVRWEPARSNQPPFENLSYAARCVAVSPAGDEIATAGGNTSLPPETHIELRPPARLDGPVQRLAGHTRIITALAYSPDGSWLASSGADGTFLWERATHAAQLISGSNAHPVAALAFEADGRRLLGGGEGGRVVLWDVSSRVVLHTYVAGPNPVRAVVFLKGGFAAASDDGFVRIWTDGNAQPRELAGIGRPILALAASADGRQLLTGDAGGNVRVWSVATGREQGILQGHTRGVQAVAYVGDGRQAVSAGADGTVRRWQLPFPQEE